MATVLNGLTLGFDSPFMGRYCGTFCRFPHLDRGKRNDVGQGSPVEYNEKCRHEFKE
ncbi:MAG: hypothetical protein RPU52_08870 [Candidatus Sedimenticola sp. (ex Thyasira tokunagai)]